MPIITIWHEKGNQDIILARCKFSQEGYRAAIQHKGNPKTLPNEMNVEQKIRALYYIMLLDHKICLSIKCRGCTCESPQSLWVKKKQATPPTVLIKFLIFFMHD